MTTLDLYIGRHAKCEKDAMGSSLNVFKEGALEQVYHEVGVPIRETGTEQIHPKDCMITFSSPDFVRTLYTGEAALIGALGLKPVRGNEVPANVADLCNFDLADVKIRQERRLSYSSYSASDVAYARGGAKAVLEHWINNPTLDVHDYQGNVANITPFAEVLKETRDALRDAVKSALDSYSKLGFMVSHAIMVEPVIFNALYPNGAELAADGNFPKGALDEIGGPVKEAEFLRLRLISNGLNRIIKAEITRNWNSDDACTKECNHRALLEDHKRYCA